MPRVTQVRADQPPRSTQLLRACLRDFLRQPDPNAPDSTIGQAQAAIYAFYDYDGQPIYVGQTAEQVATRVGRHLTGQRSDAVAKFVLDPFEVADIEVWSLPRISDSTGDTAAKRRLLNDYEAAVYRTLRAQSRFMAVLNEQMPVAHDPVDLPPSIRGRVVPAQLWDDRAHKDVRIARRAAHVARLAQMIGEREVSPGLRRTLHLQTQRLEWLSAERLRELGIAVYATEDEPTELDDETLY
jgi:hypothetical protein